MIRPIIERIALAFILAFLVVSNIAQLGLMHEQERQNSMELHKCREYIILGKDTVEVIYTKHEYRHYRMLPKENYVETRFKN